MKTWLVIVSVVAVLLAASTGVGFWMLNDTKAELASTEAELANTEAELTDTEAELTEIDETLEEARARMEIIAGIFVPAFGGEFDEMTEAGAMNYFLEWRDQIMAIGDPVLTEKFEFLMDTFSDAAFESFFLYLFESTAAALK